MKKQALGKSRLLFLALGLMKRKRAKKGEKKTLFFLRVTLKKKRACTTAESPPRSRPLNKKKKEKKGKTLLLKREGNARLLALGLLNKKRVKRGQEKKAHAKNKKAILESFLVSEHNTCKETLGQSLPLRPRGLKKKIISKKKIGEHKCRKRRSDRVFLLRLY